MTTLEIATTIQQQLHSTTPVLWSWGPSNWQAIKEDSIKGLGHSYLGALKFNVRGYLHKGHVIISLTSNDTYTVTIGSVRKGNIKPKKQVSDIHFDMLGEIIDSLVERSA